MHTDLRQASSFPQDLGTGFVLGGRLLRSAASLTWPDLAGGFPIAAKSLAHAFGHCAPLSLFYGFLTGFYLNKYVPAMAAPGLLLERILAPVSLLLAGAVFLQRDGVPQSETYSVDAREGGFQFHLDLGLHPLTRIILPRILAAAACFGLLTASTAVAVLAGISPMTVAGFATHPAIPVGITWKIASALDQGFLFGLWFGFSAFLAGITGGGHGLPGAAAARYLTLTAPLLMNIVFLELWPW